MGKCTEALARLNSQREFEKKSLDDLKVLQAELFQQIEKQRKDLLMGSTIEEVYHQLVYRYEWMIANYEREIEIHEKRFVEMNKTIDEMACILSFLMKLMLDNSAGIDVHILEKLIEQYNQIKKNNKQISANYCS